MMVHLIRGFPALALFASLAGAVEPQAVFPPGPKPVGPYSPGLIAGGMMYVSGQGARDASNNLPSTPEAQIRQALENVKGVLAGGKLTMQHVVSTNVYLADLKNYETLNKVWAEYFPKE